MDRRSDKHFNTSGALIPFFRRLLGYCFRYSVWLTYFTLAVLLVALVEALFPLLWKHLLDDVIVPASNYSGGDSLLVSPLEGSSGSGSFLPGLLVYASAFLGLGLLLALGVHGFIKTAGNIQEYVMYDIRQELFRKMQELSFSYYDRSAVGWLLSRVSSDTVKVTELISFGLIEAVWGIGMIIFCVAAMFIYDWRLALIVSSTLPVLAVISIKIRKLILKFARQARKYNSEIIARFNEHINGIEVNKSLVQEKRVSSDFNSLSGKMRFASYKSAYYSALYTPLIIFIGSASAAIVIYYGGSLALLIPPEITVGTLAAFFGYATLIYEPILDISRFYSQAQNCISAGERIFSLLDTPVTVKDNGVTGEYHRIKGDIEFDNVSFYYEKGKPVLWDFNLKMKAGESIALVGETGGGKSTIINLICRFYEPTSGKLIIDGIDYRERTIHSLRKQLGVVLQTPHLFSGTIRENVLYGYHFIRRGDWRTALPGDAEIICALDLAGASDFISRLDEQVGEEGGNLSIGEKQLISFARAILADPRIFIMDEATSSIDTLTESRIQQGIKQILKGRTSIIIAHRLSTIRNCDRILVIRTGKIIEEGNHAELMRKGGYYHHLYTRQYREERERELTTASC